MDKPTAKELWEAYWEGDDWEEEHDEVIDDDWRHGCSKYTVLKHLPSETYWSISYRVSGDGEYNEWRDEPSMTLISKVVPFEKTITSYKVVKE